MEEASLKRFSGRAGQRFGELCFVVWEMVEQNSDLEASLRQRRFRGPTVEVVLYGCSGILRENEIAQSRGTSKCLMSWSEGGKCWSLIEWLKLESWPSDKQNTLVMKFTVRRCAHVQIPTNQDISQFVCLTASALS
jgi:hypothetical protein